MCRRLTYLVSCLVVLVLLGNASADLVGHWKLDDGSGTVALATEDFVNELRSMKVTPHVAQNTNGRRSAIDRRTTRHKGYAASQKIRKRIEEAFGWIKTIAGQDKTKLRGRDRVGWAFTFAAAAFNLVRLPKLLAGPA